MITAVDTNVLIDVFGADAKYGELSANALRSALNQGALCACEMVWVESASVFSSHHQFNQTMTTLGVEFSAVEEESLAIAANAWRRYRKSGGKRERVAADFLIGAHAQVQADRLLTRDKGFFRDYFRDLAVIEP